MPFIGVQGAIKILINVIIGFIFGTIYEKWRKENEPEKKNSGSITYSRAHKICEK